MALTSPRETEFAHWRVHASQIIESRIKVPRLRPLAEFAESEIVIPDGPFKGQKFKRHRQPAHGLYFDEVDSGRWNEFWGLAPQQSGKTLSYALAPLMWHLFEHQETVIFGVPTDEIVKDKWEVDILPIIRASRYANLLPNKGPGSRGGTPGLVTFKNGSRLKFMTGGGDDEKRSAFTSRVLVVTEAEKFDERGGESLEDTKLEQLKGRVSNYGRDARMYFECTVTDDRGVMWQSWERGTASLVHLQCPDCEVWVAPEREHLAGWTDAKTELQAMEESRFSCPNCGILWPDDDRKKALRAARLLHTGQTVTASGEVEGPDPQTLSLGFRYSAATNVFAQPGVIGVKEWKRKGASPEQQESIDRTLSQWVFATPTESAVQDAEPLDVRALMHRQGNTRKGIAPTTTTDITVGVDVRKTQMHWVAWAWCGSELGPRLIDCGIELVPSSQMSLEKAIMVAGMELQEKFQSGWLAGGGANDMEIQPRTLPAAQVFADAGWKPDEVQEVCDLDEVWMPAKGFGAGVLRDRKYMAPKRETTDRQFVQAGYHVEFVRNRWLAEVDANLFKSRLHAALSCDRDSPHAALLYQVEVASELQSLCYELTAEKLTEEWKPGKGLVKEWVQIRKRNHFLDAAYLGLVAKDYYTDWMAQFEDEDTEEDWGSGSSSGGLFG